MRFRSRTTDYAIDVEKDWYEQPQLDLAALVVRVPHVSDLPPEIPQLTFRGTTDLGLGQRVTVIGQTPEIPWACVPEVEVVATSHLDNPHRVVLRRSVVEGGYSGGPVFGPRGEFLGTLVSTRDNESYVVRAESVLGFLDERSLSSTNVSRPTTRPTAGTPVTPTEVKQAACGVPLQLARTRLKPMMVGRPLGLSSEELTRILAGCQPGLAGEVREWLRAQ